MCFWKVKDGHLTILTDCPFPPFWSEILNSQHQICEKSTNLILKWTGERTGNEPETNFVIASIVGTGKPIDFYLFIKVGYYP